MFHLGCEGCLGFEGYLDIEGYLGFENEESTKLNIWDTSSWLSISRYSVPLGWWLGNQEKVKLEFQQGPSIAVSFGQVISTLQPFRLGIRSLSRMSGMTIRCQGSWRAHHNSHYHSTVGEVQATGPECLVQFLNSQFTSCDPGAVR